MKFRFVLGENNQLELPLNPTEITDTTKISNQTANVYGLGEVAIPGTKQLKRWTIESLLWYGKTPFSPRFYVNFWNTMLLSNKPFRFVVDDLGINCLVIFDELKYTYRGGEEKDIYYTISLLEYRPYGAKKVEIVQPPKTSEMPSAAVSSTTSASSPAPTPQSNPNVGDLKIGQGVYFLGGNHYVASTATAPTGGNRTAGNAKITNLAKTAPHPIHLIGMAGGSNVYGWVDSDKVRLS